MTQKVLQIGSSAGVTLSKDALRALNLKVGDRVVVEVSEDLGVILIQSAKNKLPVSLEIIAWTKSFIDRYRKDLIALAKK